VVLERVIEQRRFLDLLRYFIVFEDSAAAGTPMERTNANTRAVFGDYISVYDIQLGS
jgi:type I site-specific restriction-modification system R (restriction) subunit